MQGHTSVASLLWDRERFGRGARVGRLGCSSSSVSQSTSSLETSLNKWAEWVLIHQHCAAQYTDIDLPTSKATIAAAYSPDGKLLASTHGDHSIKITCVRTGKRLHVLRGHERTPWVVRFHPYDSDLLASGSLDHTVLLWRVSTATRIAKCDLGSGKAVTTLAFHPSEPCLAIAAGNRVFIWDISPCSPCLASSAAFGSTSDASGRDVSLHSPSRPPTFVTPAAVCVLKTRKSLRALHFVPGSGRLLLTAEMLSSRDGSGGNDNSNNNSYSTSTSTSLTRAAAAAVAAGVADLLRDTSAAVAGEGGDAARDMGALGSGDDGGGSRREGYARIRLRASGHTAEAAAAGGREALQDGSDGSSGDTPPSSLPSRPVVDGASAQREAYARSRLSTSRAVVVVDGVDDMLRDSAEDDDDADHAIGGGGAHSPAAGARPAASTAPLADSTTWREAFARSRASSARAAGGSGRIRGTLYVNGNGGDGGGVVGAAAGNGIQSMTADGDSAFSREAYARSRVSLSRVSAAAAAAEVIDLLRSSAMHGGGEAARAEPPLAAAPAEPASDAAAAVAASRRSAFAQSRPASMPAALVRAFHGFAAGSDGEASATDSGESMPSGRDAASGDLATSSDGSGQTGRCSTGAVDDDARAGGQVEAVGGAAAARAPDDEDDEDREAQLAQLSVRLMRIASQAPASSRQAEGQAGQARRLLSRLRSRTDRTDRGDNPVQAGQEAQDASGTDDGTWYGRHSASLMQEHQPADGGTAWGDEQPTGGLLPPVDTASVTSAATATAAAAAAVLERDGDGTSSRPVLARLRSLQNAATANRRSNASQPPAADSARSRSYTHLATSSGATSSRPRHYSPAAATTAEGGPANHNGGGTAPVPLLGTASIPSRGDVPSTAASDAWHVLLPCDLTWAWERSSHPSDVPAPPQPLQEPPSPPPHPADVQQRRLPRLPSMLRYPPRQLTSPADANDRPSTSSITAWAFNPQQPTATLRHRRLSLPRAVLCSEMGFSVSRCGRYLAACVARDGPSHNNNHNGGSSNNVDDGAAAAALASANSPGPLFLSNGAGPSTSGAAGSGGFAATAIQGAVDDGGQAWSADVSRSASASSMLAGGTFGGGGTAAGLGGGAGGASRSGSATLTAAGGVAAHGISGTGEVLVGGTRGTSVTSNDIAGGAAVPVGGTVFLTGGLSRSVSASDMQRLQGVASDHWQAGSSSSIHHALTRSSLATSAAAGTGGETLSCSQQQQQQQQYDLQVLSLDAATFGDVLCSRPAVAVHCLTSVQLSPTCEHVLLGYGRRHMALYNVVVDGVMLLPACTCLEVYRVSDMQLVRSLPSLEDEVNVAVWHPHPGGGLAYGTKEGRLRILRLDRGVPQRCNIPSVQLRYCQREQQRGDSHGLPAEE